MTFPRIARLLALALMLTATPAAAEITSFYGSESGRTTANGERFIPNSRHGQHTCAHWHFRFNTRLEVTDLATGKSVICRVNDRGPAGWTGAHLDLSRGAAAELGIIHRGRARVSIRVL
jgi:rare lipoprotein A